MPSIIKPSFDNLKMYLNKNCIYAITLLHYIEYTLQKYALEVNIVYLVSKSLACVNSLFCK